MRTQVRMSAPMGARLTSQLASPLVVATPGRVAHWLRVKTAHPEEGRERERGESLALRSARKQKGKKYERTLHSRCRKKKKRKNRRGGEKRVRSGFGSRFSLSLARGDRYALLSCTLSSVFFSPPCFLKKNLRLFGFDSRIIDSSRSLLHPAVLGSGC